MKKEFLNEESYQRTKKVLIVLGIIAILVPAVLSYIFFIKPGLDIYKEAENYSIPTEEEIQTQEDEINAEYDGLLEELEMKYDELETEIEAKYTKEMGDDGWFDEQSTKNDEIFELNKQYGSDKIDLESERSDELFETESVTVAELKQDEMKFPGTQKLIIGGIIAFAGIVAGIALLAVAFGRNVLGFKVQQTMPIAQEGVEKMAPSVGNLAKEVTKGVKEGLQEEDKE